MTCKRCFDIKVNYTSLMFLDSRFEKVKQGRQVCDSYKVTLHFSIYRSHRNHKVFIFQF